MKLQGKVALITGGGTGIGRALALALAQEGAHLVVTGRRLEPLQEVAKRIGASGGQVRLMSGDVALAGDARRMVEECLGAFGRLDVLVNNAGIWRGGKITDTSEEEWDRIFATNVKGIYQMSRYALPYLVAKEGRPGGSIINISSVTGLVGRPGAAAYVASKGAVTQLTKAMALDHAREGVRVNCICPGLVETEAVVEGLSAEQYQALLAERLPEHPIGRLGHPEDIAPFIVYLASDEAQWVTGAAFAVDGGYTAR